MEIDLKSLSTNKVYYTLTQSIIPRPVAWVLSENQNGTFNLAPFSYFSGVSSNPPILMISVGKKKDGTFKDTKTNIELRSEFVVHIPHQELATEVTQSSVELPAEQSELDQLQLKLTPLSGSKLPRIAQCKVAFACQLHSIQEVGETPQVLILGKINSVYLDDSIATIDHDRLTIDPLKLNPIARLGGDLYSTLGQIINIPRPK